MTAYPPRTVAVDGASPYSIHIGPGVSADGALLAKQIRGRHVLLASDSHVAPLYAAKVRGRNNVNLAAESEYSDLQTGVFAQQSFAR